MVSRSRRRRRGARGVRGAWGLLISEAGDVGCLHLGEDEVAGTALGGADEGLGGALGSVELLEAAAARCAETVAGMNMLDAGYAAQALGRLSTEGALPPSATELCHADSLLDESWWCVLIVSSGAMVATVATAAAVAAAAF